MRINKRGQVTPFIIVGIMIVIIAVILIVFMKPRISKPTITSTAQIDPIRDYVEECIETKVKENALNLRIYNGFFENSSDTLYNSDTDLTYNLAYYFDASGFHSKFYLPEIEREFKDRVIVAIENCPVENTFSQSGYNIIRPNKIDVNIEFDRDYIMDSLVIVKVDYPLKISKGDVSIELEKFEVVVNDPIFRFLEIEQAIVNHVLELDGKTFDVIDFVDRFAENKNADLNDNIIISVDSFSQPKFVLYKIRSRAISNDKLEFAGKDK